MIIRSGRPWMVRGNHGNRSGNDQVHLFLVGLLIFVLVPMIFPNARSGSNTLKTLGSYIEGFFNVSKCTRSGLWSEMVRTSGRYFKRSPPPQATTNQESQVKEQVDYHEDIEVSFIYCYDSTFSFRSS